MIDLAMIHAWHLSPCSMVMNRIRKLLRVHFLFLSSYLSILLQKSFARRFELSSLSYCGRNRMTRSYLATTSNKIHLYKNIRSQKVRIIQTRRLYMERLVDDRKYARIVYYIRLDVFYFEDNERVCIIRHFSQTVTRILIVEFLFLSGTHLSFSLRVTTRR